jgi:hypothetical protein
MNAHTPIDVLFKCKPWIEQALKRSGNLNTWDEVCAGIRSGKMQLWPAERGCIVTEIVVYHDKNALHVFLAGGELDEILQMTESVKEWAKLQGCSFATFDGRFGWQKPLEKIGWKPHSITMHLEF